MSDCESLAESPEEEEEEDAEQEIPEENQVKSSNAAARHLKSGQRQPKLKARQTGANFQSIEQSVSKKPKVIAQPLIKTKEKRTGKTIGKRQARIPNQKKICPVKGQEQQSLGNSPQVSVDCQDASESETQEEDEDHEDQVSEAEPLTSRSMPRATDQPPKEAKFVKMIMLQQKKLLRCQQAAERRRVQQQQLRDKEQQQTNQHQQQSQIVEIQGATDPTEKMMINVQEEEHGDSETLAVPKRPNAEGFVDHKVDYNYNLSQSEENSWCESASSVSEQNNGEGTEENSDEESGHEYDTEDEDEDEDGVKPASTRNMPCGEENSDDEDEDEDEDEDDEDDEDADIQYDLDGNVMLPDGAEAPKAARRARKAACELLNDRNSESDVESQNPSERSLRSRERRSRLVMNVAQTIYEVVRKVGRKVCNYKIRQWKEDSEGGVRVGVDADGEAGGVGSGKLSTGWDLSWHDLPVTADFLSKMAPYQKVNQFPGIYVIARKNYLARNLMRMAKAFPTDYNFFPKTWVLPFEQLDLRQHYQTAKASRQRVTYIAKPDSLSQGKGIFLSRDVEKIIQICSNQTENQALADHPNADMNQHDSGQKLGYVVQQYMDRPHLIEDLKYDLRLYVFLYGVAPMRIYLHKMAFARFCTQTYQKPTSDNMDNLFMHLTNYAINKFADGYEDADDVSCDDEESGHKRSLGAILQILHAEGADVHKFMQEIKDQIVKTVITAQPYLSHLYRVCQPDCLDNSMCFQILGFDVMIDHKFKPWLLEVNASPSFETDTSLDYKIKKNVLADAFRMLNLSYEKRMRMTTEKRRQTQNRILTGKIQRMSKQERAELSKLRLAERFKYEAKRLRGYEMIYPCADRERNQQYEEMLKKANDFWDEFTTGKSINRSKPDKTKLKKDPVASTKVSKAPLKTITSHLASGQLLPQNPQQNLQLADKKRTLPQQVFLGQKEPEHVGNPGTTPENSKSLFRRQDNQKNKCPGPPDQKLVQGNFISNKMQLSQQDKATISRRDSHHTLGELESHQQLKLAEQKNSLALPGRAIVTNHDQTNPAGVEDIEAKNYDKKVIHISQQQVFQMAVTPKEHKTPFNEQQQLKELRLRSQAISQAACAKSKQPSGADDLRQPIPVVLNQQFFVDSNETDKFQSKSVMTQRQELEVISSSSIVPQGDNTISQKQNHMVLEKKAATISNCILPESHRSGVPVSRKGDLIGLSPLQLSVGSEMRSKNDLQSQFVAQGEPPA